MTLFDYTVLFIIGSSVLVSVVRGFTREALSLLGWVLAFLLANMLSGVVSEWFAPLIKDATLRVLVAFVAVFVVTLVLASIGAMMASRLLKNAGLGLEDRLLGGFFGFARGLLIVLALVLVSGLTALPKQPVWSDAVLSPPLEALAAALKPWLPGAAARYLSYD
jgi:membrane protein required for colicin V production